MRHAWVLVVMSGLVLTACHNTYGSLLVRVALTGETRTKCVSVSVPGFAPLSVPRDSDEVLVAISESRGLTGTIEVTVQRFASTDCKSMPIGSAEKKSGLLKLNTKNELTFSYTDEVVDAGFDAGIDAGVDAGCDVARCALMTPICSGSPTCLANGSCGYTTFDAGTGCGDAGACSAQGQCRPACEVLPPNSACNDGLACTMNDTCSGTKCSGSCSTRECLKAMTVCDPGDVSGLSCQYTALTDNTSCMSGQGQCLTGVCLPKLLITPSNVSPSVTAYDYPDGGWVTSAGCETIIDTSLTPPGPIDGGWCSSKGPTSRVGEQLTPDAGQVAIFAMTGLTVSSGSKVRFVGSRPAILLVLGDATIDGTLSAASDGVASGAGANSPWCALAGGVGSSVLGGGGGGALGAQGGRGAADGGGEGGLSAGQSIAPLRGGCAGGAAGSATGGTGGGALQVTVGGTLTLGDAGVVSVSGGGGRGGSATFGGGGGGSAGMLVLEALTLNQFGFITANGGAGGAGGLDGGAGEDGPIASTSAAQGGAGPNAGGIGGNGVSPGGGNALTPALDFGGGGGGSSSYLYLRATTACTKTPTNISGQLKGTGSCQ